MKNFFLLLICSLFLMCNTNAQKNTGLVIGDYNKTGDFIGVKPSKVFDLDLTKENLKFAKIKLGDKDMVISYKMTGSNSGAIRYFDSNKNEWVDLLTVDCCTERTSGKLMIYDAKHFKTKYDILFFYSETAKEPGGANTEKKQLQIVKFIFNSAFKKYNIVLNPLNQYPHKVVVSKWTIREQFGDNEDKYQEFSIDTKEGK